MSKEAKVFQVLDMDGKVVELVEAESAAKVRAYLLRDRTIHQASGQTVAKWMQGGGNVSKAQQ